MLVVLDLCMLQSLLVSRFPKTSFISLLEIIKKEKEVIWLIHRTIIKDDGYASTLFLYKIEEIIISQSVCHCILQGLNC